MPRIFLALASFNTLALLATAVLGFFTPSRAEPTGADLFAFHLPAALASLVFALLVHSMAFTYFLGTSRWVKEVVQAYQLSGALYQQAAQLKRGTVRFVMPCAALAIATAVTGAAADLSMLPGPVHLITAGAFIGLNVWGHVAEYDLIKANCTLLESVMDQVRQLQQAAR